MSKKGGDVPAAPDPTKTIAAQTAANTQAAKDNAQYSAVDMYGPSGSVTYLRRPDGTPYAQTTSLTPQGQQIFSTEQGITGTLADQAQSRVNQLPTTGFELNTPYSTNYDTNSMLPTFQGGSNLPYDPSKYGDINQYDDAAGHAAFNEAYGFAQPAMAMEDERTMQNINDRGLPVGGAAYTSAMNELQQNHNQQIQSFANQATATAAQSGATKLQEEQGVNTNAFNQAAQTNQLQTSNADNKIQTEQNLDQTAIANDLLQRQENMNEASAYLTGAPALQEPGAVAAPTYHTNSTDVAGITNSAYQNQMSAYNAQTAQNGSKWQGAANIAGSVAPLMF